MNKPIQKITPFLWFDHQAEEAARFYTSIFKNSRVETVTRYGESGPGPKGSVMTVAFQIEGQEFVALNGGPLFKFTEAISFVVNCETQAEVDELWEKLSEGGKE
jgi:predicted 3-demethylubiquinone-9 3-methyltransferase (glyoxalase superfamily)